MNKFWVPSRIFTYDVSPQPIDYINCDGRLQLPTLSSGIPFNAHWKQNIAVSSFWCDAVLSMECLVCKQRCSFFPLLPCYLFGWGGR